MSTAAPPELDATHREIQGLAREFARGEIAPHAERWNREHHVPVEALRRMGELGFLGVIIPEEYGGAGLDYTCLALVIEEIAAVDAGTSVGVAAQNSLGASPIVAHGTEEQRARLLPPLASGERFAAYALTEPDAGSDAAGLRTSATRDGDHWVVRGSKQWITNGGFADLFVLFARTGGPGARGVSAFVAERGDGFTVGREMPKMGLHTSSTVELAFDGYRLPADAMLADEGAGMKVAFSTLDSGRVIIAAQACGIARAALETAVDYARERTAFGGPIGRFQGVQFPLAEIAARLDAARLLTLHAARLRDAGRPHTAVGAKAKLVASQVAVDAANACVQTLGGYGYSAEYPAERYYRDAKITQIYEGTSEIQRLVIARDLLGEAARG
ncbi:acyl-CoA dehydrogenase family protein [Miltoncostaea marina]|uniref:acyl-CoA dehydrogenase family protein n=1 Tax=Miltoncostaea marina TaxID=2843215 RepID=UPI001C3C5EF6|nr:acyl-CoA dehydrogenase family protein [Miltoncostaea marina]